MNNEQNVVSMRRSNRRNAGFATAADSFDIESLMRDLDGQGANSTSYRYGTAEGETVIFGSRAARHAA